MGYVYVIICQSGIPTLWWNDMIQQIAIGTSFIGKQYVK